MNDTDDLLIDLKEHADWISIENGDYYTAGFIREAIDEIKRLRALVDAKGE